MVASMRSDSFWADLALPIVAAKDRGLVPQYLGVQQAISLSFHFGVCSNVQCVVALDI